jgi:hypothetical protein
MFFRADTIYHYFNYLLWSSCTFFSHHIYPSSHPIPRCWTLRNQFRQRNQFHLIPGIPSRWILTDSREFLSISEFGSIPATSTDSGSNEFPEFRNLVQTELDGIACDSGIERNWNWFPESDGIPSNSALTQFPEFRTGIAYTYCELTFGYNTMHAGEGGDRFRYGIPRIAWKRNS